MNLLLGMTTADRGTGRNYLGQTVSALVAQGVTPQMLHLFPTSPQVKWLRNQIPVGSVTLHTPSRVLDRNENGIALMLGMPQCDWVLNLEDDLAFCRRFVPSVKAWLTKHEDERYRGYFFFARHGRGGKTDAHEYSTHGAALGFLAVALRWSDAQDFGQWAQERRKTWRRSNGFDELFKLWVRKRYPTCNKWLYSRPCFVQHIGDQSIAHPGWGRRITPHFAGSSWSYPSSVHVEGGTPC